MIKWGVIGTGHMANIFAESIQETDNAKLVAVSSRTKKSLEIFGDRFNIKENLRFISNEEICKSEDIDAIYISTLNNTHFDLIKLCAINKKNILCEKPFCLNLNEAKELQKIIIINKVMFFEAIAYLSHPQTSVIHDLSKLKVKLSQLNPHLVLRFEKSILNLGYLIRNSVVVQF